MALSSPRGSTIFQLWQIRARATASPISIPGIFLLGGLLLLPTGCSHAGSEGETWYFYTGMLVLISFIPLTVVSYRGIRLHRKQEEYKQVMERLSELSIDNVQNLVKASLVELIIKTPFKPRQLIDWMLQGRLYLYFKNDVIQLRKAGIRTILGFKIVGDQDNLASLAQITGLDIAYLEIVYGNIKDSVSLTRLHKAKDCLHSI